MTGERKALPLKPTSVCAETDTPELSELAHKDAYFRTNFVLSEEKFNEFLSLCGNNSPAQLGLTKFTEAEGYKHCGKCGYFYKDNCQCKAGSGDIEALLSVLRSDGTVSGDRIYYPERKLRELLASINEKTQP